MDRNASIEEGDSFQTEDVPVKFAKAALGDPFGEVELAYLDWGEATAKQAAICVHGLTRNARDFDVLARNLVEHGMRVIAVDVVGRGRSSWLSDPKDYAVPTYAAHLRRFLEILGLRTVDWIGTSMGGLIGMAIAGGEASPIRRLVLNDIGPAVPNAALSQIRAYLGVDQQFESLEALENHLRFIHAGFGRLTDAQWRHLAVHSARQTPDGWQFNYDKRIRFPFLEAAANDIDLWELWDKIQCPTFVLHGEESNILLRPTTDEMTTRGPKAEIIRFPGVGHAPALMSEDQISAVVSRLMKSSGEALEHYPA